MKWVLCTTHSVLISPAPEPSVQAISLSLVLVPVLRPLLVFLSLLPTLPSILGLLPADVNNS